MRVLFVAEQLNPQWSSVPLVAYNLWNALTELVDVHLVTHERNREAIEMIRNGRAVEYVRESDFIAWYFHHAQKIATLGGKTRWPLYHALGYPVYAAFNRRVRTTYGPRIQKGEFDILHAFTPVIPRYPVALVRDCRKTPFVLGPVNGGLPYPAAFGDVGRSESARLNVLRHATRLIPGYSQTYKNADLVLSGSGYTMGMLESRFPGLQDRMALFHENGVTDDFFLPPNKSETDDDSMLRILFVGRLVPYKGADMLLQAVARSKADNAHVTIVGDGEERLKLEAMAEALGLSQRVTFTGWIEQSETREHYQSSDLFVFPSVREFGGAVVLEAMAAGLPCVVVNHGGIGEYVTEQCAIAIEPASREHVIKETAKAIDLLAANPVRRKQLSKGAVQRAEEYRWNVKAQWLVQQYEKMLANANEQSGTGFQRKDHA